GAERQRVQHRPAHAPAHRGLADVGDPPALRDVRVEPPRMGQGQHRSHHPDSAASAGRRGGVMAATPALVESLGWAATAVFFASYFTRPSLLARVQMIGALMWIAYGVLQHALPVVVANLLGVGADARAGT